MSVPQTPSFTVTETIRTAGEGFLHLTAAVPGCDWGRRGAESAVATITLNGAHCAELVLHQGEKLTEYTVALGHLDPGMPLIGVTLRPDLSPAGARELRVENASVGTIPKTHPDYLLWRYAPRLYGRPDNATSDTPLLLLARVQNEGLYTRIAYAFVWSDQDRDRGVLTRMAHDGTPTDIDWVYELYLNRRTGEIPKTVVLGAGETTTSLRGRFIESHPVLATSTLNNMVSLKGTSPLLFALPPVWAYDETRGPRERALDSFPWATELAMKEIQREGRLAWETFDPRHYLYLDFRASLPSGALLAAQAILPDGRISSSDRNSESLSLAKNGWNRTALLVPPGAPPTQLRFVRRDSNPTPHLIQNVTAFRLDSKFQPQQVTLRVVS